MKRILLTKKWRRKEEQREQKVGYQIMQVQIKQTHSQSHIATVKIVNQFKNVKTQN